MAEGIYMGGEELKGIEGSQIRKLVNMIKTQKEKFATQAGKAKIWDLGGDFIQGLLSLTGVPGIVAGHGLDLLIDQISGRTLMSGTKAGDPEAIEKLETAYTGGGYGEEFGKMIKESRPDLGSGILQEGTEGIKSLILGEAAGGFPLGEGSKFAESDFGKWISSLFAQGGRVPSPKKYYGGGSVSGSPTISDYFAMQNKTLGGSNKQSLAEKLGRI